MEKRKQKLIRLPEVIYNQLNEEATKELRSFTAHVEYVLKRHIELKKDSGGKK